MINDKIYLDYQATTPMDNRVLTAMMPFLDSFVGNPMSKHWAGLMANEAIETSRESIADILNVEPEEIIFTSGATEAINILLKGMAWGLKEKGNHIITTRIEHKAVLDTCKHLQISGFHISYAEVDTDGFVRKEELEKLIKDETIMAVIGHANNEIGVIQDLDKISSICKSKGIHLFSDCAQSFGKVDFELKNIDSIAFSGHKIYGPMGIGGLYLNREWHSLIHKPVHGGGQEYGLRPGTHNVPAIEGLAEAVRISRNDYEDENTRLKNLRDGLWTKIKSEFSEAELNGGLNCRLAGNINFSIPFIPSELIINKLSDRFAFSAGSACMSKENEPSHVILALGKHNHIAESAIRVSLGRFTTKKEVDNFANALIETVNDIKDIINF